MNLYRSAFVLVSFFTILTACSEEREEYSKIEVTYTEQETLETKTTIYLEGEGYSRENYLESCETMTKNDFFCKDFVEGQEIIAQYQCFRDGNYDKLGQTKIVCPDLRSEDSDGDVEESSD